jgi:hypothetical protein
VGVGHGCINNSIRTVLLQLGLPFRLGAPLYGLFEQSKKNVSPEGTAKQIPKATVHKILHTHILSLYGGIPINCSQFAGGLARPHTADNSFL